MGNAPSFSLRRRRAHLDESTVYTKPSGLYATCAWDEKYVRKLILREELAPRHPGQDDRSQVEPEECPICMLHYPSLNETKCCAARLCTECYLQIRPPPRHSKEPCPFCKYKKLDAVYRGPRDKRELARELEDERRATDAMRRASSRAPLPVHAGPSGLAATSSYPGPLTPPPPSDSDESEQDATEAGSLVPLDSAYDSTQGGPSRTLRSITSDATVSSAASAAAQAGNSAASASSSSVILENERASVDVATTRRFPYPYCGPEFPRMKFCVSADSDVPVIFSQEPENEEYPPSEDADSCAMQLSASSVDCCETVYTLSLNEAIHRSLLEM